MWCCLNKTLVNILILGFYNRGNTGDEMYKISLRKILGNYDPSTIITFLCMDDCNRIPNGTDIVICGGGDIINPYFMEKAKVLLTDFKGRTYALSVGIPYPDGTSYLYMFDHVFVRSKTDYDFACVAVGKRNVTFMTDACSVLTIDSYASVLSKNNNTRHVTPRLGICLAQPIVSSQAEIIDNLSIILNAVHQQHPDMQIHLIPFNYFKMNKDECDIIPNCRLAELLHRGAGNCGSGGGRVVVNHIDITSPEHVVAVIRQMDVCVCMRYHSAVFAKRSILIAHTPKMKKLALDRGEVIHKVSLNLIKVINNAFTPQLIANRPSVKSISHVPIEFINNIIFSPSHRVSLLVPKHKLTMSYEQVIEVISRYPICPHLICYILTGSVNSKFVWGLEQTLNKDHSQKVLEEAIMYLYDEVKRKQEQEAKLPREYCPDVVVDRSLGFIEMHPDLGFESYHRSGWPFAVKGLLNAARNNGKETVFFDPYVDKTFHWGYNTFSHMGLIPYQKKWAGVIHHTFWPHAGPNHCGKLFKNKLFVTSLKHCVCLIALSETLAKALRMALGEIGFGHVPVKVVMHPTEFGIRPWNPRKYFPVKQQSLAYIPSLNLGHILDKVDRGDWEMEKPRYSRAHTAILGDELYHLRSIVQIGDWLRDPDGIIDLPLDPELDFVKKILCATGKAADRTSSSTCGVVLPIIPKLNVDIEYIDYVTNDKYDDLLTSSVVFLKLWDCSAVNTVIECIARNTPIVVNRLPAVEEVLGADYPGLWDTLEQAAAICEDDAIIDACHKHLIALSKSQFHIEQFVKNVMNAIFTV